MRKITSVAVAGILGLAGMLAAGTSNASPIVFQTASGASSGGQPVSASASFSLSAGSLQIVLTDSQANPVTVAQLISGLSFNLGSGLTSGTLQSSLASFIYVNSGGTITPDGSGATSWLLQSGTSGFDLCEICNGVNGGSGPAELIIGPPNGSGLYSAAKGSIAGNSPHNPFINQTGTYTLNITGLSANDTISNVVFRFGTTYGTSTTNGICTSGCGGTSVPEPSTLALFGAGLLGCALFINRRRRASRRS